MSTVEVAAAAMTDMSINNHNNNGLAHDMKAYTDTKQTVKGLIDSGMTTIPDYFIHEPENIPNSAPAPSSEIPVIDLNHPDRQLIITQLKSAASTWGFFQLINHSIPSDIHDSAISSMRAFHEQSSELKAQFYRNDMRNGSGFTSNAQLSWGEKASWYDNFQIRLTPEPIDFDAVIPQVCRKELVEWAEEVKKLGHTLLGLLAEGLGLNSSKFEEIGLLDSRSIGGNYYPPCPQPELTLGLRDHTDRGSITILSQNEVVGLQVKRENAWVDVKPLPGAVVVNIGDTLEIVSNGEYKSIVHQVRATDLKSPEPRVSLAHFFWAGKEDYTYGPLPELISTEKPATFGSFTLEEFRQMFSNKTVGSKSLVERLRL